MVRIEHFRLRLGPEESKPQGEVGPIAGEYEEAREAAIMIEEGRTEFGMPTGAESGLCERASSKLVHLSDVPTPTEEEPTIGIRGSLAV